MEWRGGEGRRVEDRERRGGYRGWRAEWSRKNKKASGVWRSERRRASGRREGSEERPASREGGAGGGLEWSVVESVEWSGRIHA